MQYWRSELCSLLDIASKHKYWSLSLYQDQGNRQDMSKVYRKITVKGKGFHKRKTVFAAKIILFVESQP